MYVLGSQQCSMPNSESPITQAQIDAEQAFLDSVGTAFDDGNLALNSLLQALGGNPAGDTISGAQGVPTTGTLDTYAAGIPVVPQPADAPAMSLLPDVNDFNFWRWANSPWGGQGGGWPGYDSPRPARNTGGTRRGAGKNFARYSNTPVQQNQEPPSNCPVIVPLVTAIPIPQNAPVAPAQTPVSAPAPVAVPAPVAAVPPTPLPDCRTGNICLDIMNGCVLSSQVDPQQLMACSAAGYVGNKNLYPAIAAAGGADGGAFLGTPDPSPAPYVPGMSGFGQDSAAQSSNADIFSSAFEYAISGVFAILATALFAKMGGKR